VKRLSIVLLAALVWSAPAESPQRVPRELADEIEAIVQENVLRTFKVLKEGKQDVPAFERALSQMLIYIRQGSMTNKSPQLLLSELNGYCNPTNDPLWSEFISGLCTSYQRFYETNPRDVPNHHYLRCARHGIFDFNFVTLRFHVCGVLKLGGLQKCGTGETPVPLLQPGYYHLSLRDDFRGCFSDCFHAISATPSLRMRADFFV
jgi:hypothetical protein